MWFTSVAILVFCLTLASVSIELDKSYYDVPSIPFTAEALAIRSLGHRWPFARRLRANVNTWLGHSNQAALAQSSSPGGRGVLAPTDQKFSSSQFIQRLHASSEEVAEYLKVLNDFGEFETPLVRDFTGRVGATPTLDRVCDYLRKTPQSLLVFRWTEPILSPEQHMIRDVMALLKNGNDEDYKDPRDYDQDSQLRILRQQIRNIRIMWLVNGNDLESLSPELLEAMSGVEHARAELKRLETHDATFASVVGEGAVGVIQGRTSARDFEMLDDLANQAQDDALYDRDFDKALSLYREIEEFSARKVETLPIEAPTRHSYVTHLDKAREWIDRIQRGVVKAPLIRRPEVAAATLTRIAGSGLSIQIPGADLRIESIDGAVEVFAFVLRGAKGASFIAPWLYGLTVGVWQPRLPESLEGTLPVEGILVAITNESTKKTHIKALGRTLSDANNDRMESVDFSDLVPGTYRIRFLSDVPSVDDGNGVTGGRIGSRWLSAIRRWRAALFSLDPSRQHDVRLLRQRIMERSA